MFPTVSGSAISWISREQMIEVDRAMIDDLHIELLQMMENAGRNLAHVALTTWSPNQVAVVAGSGGNGGGGMVAARHLHNAGVDTTVLTSRPPEEMSSAARHQHDIITRMGIETRLATTRTELGEPDLVLDALLGYSLDGAPRGVAVELIADINQTRSDVLALDTPSGLDVTTGVAHGAVVDATATLTLALPKIGLRASRHVGKLLVADISVPQILAQRMGSAPPNFSSGPVLLVRT